MIKRILTIYVLFFLRVFADIGVIKVAQGFDKPVYLLPIPDTDNELLVLEQKGLVRFIKNNKISNTPFLDIRDRVHKPLFPGDEMGLLGFTFDPDFDQSKYCYVHYNDKDDKTVISRFKVKGKYANKSSEKIILTLLQPYSNHNGGTIEFGKDGYLYIATL